MTRNKDTSSTEILLDQILVHNKYRYVKYLDKDKILNSTNIKLLGIQQSITNKAFDNTNNRDLLLLKKYIKEDNHIQILNLLEKLTKENSIPTNILRQFIIFYKYHTFLNLDKYIRLNLYIPKVISKFLDFYKSFLPSDFLQILLNTKIDLDSFKFLINKIKYFSIKNIPDCLLEVESIRKYILQTSFSININIYKYGKRDDIEFYIRLLKPDLLEEYLSINNFNIKCIHMNVLRACSNNMKDINNILDITNNIVNITDTNITSRRKDIINYIKKFINLPSLFYREVDILLLQVIIDLILLDFNINELINDIFYYNKIYKNINISKQLYHSLINRNKINVLVKHIDDFISLVDPIIYKVIKKEYIPLNLLDKYISTTFVGLIKEYILNEYTWDVVYNHVLNKYEDERVFYYEILFNLIDTSNSNFLEINSNFLEINSTNKYYIMTLNKILENTKSRVLYNKLKGTPLFNKYILIHYKEEYFKGVNKKECTLEEGMNIYRILKEKGRRIERNSNNKEEDIEDQMESNQDGKNSIINKKYRNMAHEYFKDKEEGNFIYNISVSYFRDLDLIKDKILLLYYVSNIRYDDGMYIFYKYYDIYSININKDLRKGIDTISNNVINTNSITINNNTPLCTSYWGNKYILHIIDIPSNVLRYVIKYIPVLPGKYIPSLIYLLSDANSNVVGESKRLLMNMTCLNTDIENIKSQIVECFMNKMNVSSTLVTLMGLQINYMLDNTSLYFLIELVRRFSKEYKEKIFLLVYRIYDIVIDKSYYNKEISRIISQFVVQNSFYIEECIRILKRSCISIRDLDILLEHIERDLRVSYIIVEVVKDKGDILCREVIDRININKCTNFLAYGFRLGVFNEYISVYFPRLKEIYISKNRDISVHAFKSLISENVVYEYVEEECFTNPVTRYSSIEILSSIIQDNRNGLDDGGNRNTGISITNIHTNITSKTYAILYIFKFDSNSLIRKQVHDILKGRVDNYNKLFKKIYKYIIEYLERYYLEIEDICYNVLGEFILKYCSIIEYEYIRRYQKVYETYLICGLKKGKMVEESIGYCKENVSVEIMNMLLGLTRNRNIYKEDTRKEESIGKKDIRKEIGKKDKDSTSITYPITNTIYTTNNTMSLPIISSNPFLIVLYDIIIDKIPLSITDISLINILNYNKDILPELIIHCLSKDIEVQDLCTLLSNNQKGTILTYMVHKDIHMVYRQTTIYILNTIQNINILSYPTDIIYLYSQSKGDVKVFKYLFNILNNEDIQILLIDKNYEYIKEASYKNVLEYDRLVNVLVKHNTVRSIERIQEIYPLVGDKNKKRIVEYYLYNYLIYDYRGLIRNILKDIGDLYEDMYGDIYKEMVMILIK